MESLGRAASPDFPLSCFQQTGGHSTGSKFLGIFTQHPINKMAMLLEVSYNQAYCVMSPLINLPKKAGCYLSLFGERLAMGRKKNSGIRLTSMRSRFK